MRFEPATDQISLFWAQILAHKANAVGIACCKALLVSYRKHSSNSGWGTVQGSLPNAYVLLRSIIHLYGISYVYAAYNFCYCTFQANPTHDSSR